MDSRAADWLFALSPPSDDLFMLPANISSSSLWTSVAFPDVVFPLDPLPQPPQLPSPTPAIAIAAPLAADDVSDTTDAQLSAASPRKPVVPPDVPEERLADDSTSRKHVRQTPQQRFMPPLRLRAGRDAETVTPGSKTTTTMTTALKETGGRRRSQGEESSRQRHNAMMRENRGRFNLKFRELTALLERLSVPSGKENGAPNAKPMKNKIQILERAMLQYAGMESERAKCKSQLLFADDASRKGSERERDVLASGGGGKEACEMVVRALCAGHNWKYGEVWSVATGAAGDASAFTLQSAYVSPRNMPATRARLEAHARGLRAAGGAAGIAGFLCGVSRLRHAVWVPDAGSRRDGAGRKAAGVTTALAVRVSAAKETAVLVVMHADDELLSFPGGVRPYDREAVERVTELAGAVEETVAARR